MANKIIIKKSSVAAKIPLSTDLEVGEIAGNLEDQKLYSKKPDGTVVLMGQGIGGDGDVVGPSSATNGAVALYDGTTGKLIKNGQVPGSIYTQNANNVNITGGSISGITDLAITDGGTGASTAAAARFNLGAGDVEGPTSSFNNRIVLFSGSSGKVIKNSPGSTIDANDRITAESYIAFGSGANKMPVGTTAERPTAPMLGEYRMNSTTGEPEWYNETNDTWVPFGDVTGPASATDNALTRFDGTTGKLVQNSSATLDDSGNLSLVSGGLNIGSGQFSIDTTGRVSIPNQPAFLAQAQSADITFDSPAIIPWPEVLFNRGGYYNNSTNRFTAPIDGVYHFSFTVNGITSNADRTYPRINGVTVNDIHTRGSSSLADYHYTTMSIVLSLNAGDYVDVEVRQGAVNTFYANHFCGFLIG